jgi:hypothetical protein
MGTSGGDEGSQRDCRRVGMGTSHVLNGIADLYWSYTMSSILRKRQLIQCPQFFAVAHSYLWWRPSFVANHLLLVINAVKVTEEGQVWVPAVCQVIQMF